MHGPGMAEIITLPFRRSRLPRRLLNDGWWLESKPGLPTVVALPARGLSKAKPGPHPKRSHLTLVIAVSEK
jgi:hypothetical protein